MFEDLKRFMFEEIKQEIISLKENQEKLETEIKEYRDKEYKLIGNSNKIDERLSNFMDNYSKLSKFFNRKKYENELRKLHSSIKEENTSKIKEVSDLIKLGEEKKHTNNVEIEKHLDALKEVEKAKSIEELPITFEKAKELLSKNNIDILSYSYDEIFKLGPSKETTGNILFMKKAINDEPYNILYDQTNNFDMYCEFIKHLECNTDDKTLKKNFDISKEKILDILEKSKNGLTYIRPVHLLEVIRFYFKDTIMYENGVLGMTGNDYINTAIIRIKEVIKTAMKLSKDDYDELERMYNPENNNYYCHRTGTPGVEKAIFQNGLRISTQGNDRKRVIVRNARKVDCFLAMAGYCNFYAGNGAGESRIILEIPKECERPIGSDTIGGETYVLPDYVMASLYDDKPIHDENGALIGYEKSVLHVNNQNKKKYRYLYKDGYNEKTPYPIENPEYEEEIERGKGI